LPSLWYHCKDQRISYSLHSLQICEDIPNPYCAKLVISSSNRAKYHWTQCTKFVEIHITQRYQNKVLRCLVNAPWYARNSDIRWDLGVETVASVTARHAILHENRLQHHVNEVASASRLLNVQHLMRRLKQTKPFELVRQLRDPMGKLSSTSC
jgi:hypothetical protein